MKSTAKVSFTQCVSKSMSDNNSAVQRQNVPFEHQNWPSTPSRMAYDHDWIWSNAPEATGDLTGLSLGPFIPDNLNQFQNTFSYDIGTVTDMSSSKSPDSEIRSGYESASDTGALDLSLQLFCSSRSSLSPGVLYNDTHHKFGPVLSLCKLDTIQTPE